MEIMPIERCAKVSWVHQEELSELTPHLPDSHPIKIFANPRFEHGVCRLVGRYDTPEIVFNLMLIASKGIICDRHELRAGDRLRVYLYRSGHVSQIVKEARLFVPGMWPSDVSTNAQPAPKATPLAVIKMPLQRRPTYTGYNQTRVTILRSV